MAAETQQFLSLAFIILLNGVTLLLVFSEYRRSRHRFMGAVTVAQLAALLWHLCTGWLALQPASTLGPFASAASTWGFSLGFLAAVLLLRGRFSRHAILGMAGGPLLLAAGLQVVSGVPAALLLWTLAAAALTVVPAIMLTAPLEMRGLRWGLGSIHVLIALCFDIGLVLVFRDEQQMGRLLYFFNAMLIPASAHLFLQYSLHLSTREIRESERRHRELFDSLIDAYFWLDDSGRIEAASPSFRQFGYDARALMGHELSSLVRNCDDFEARLEKARTQGPQSFPASVLHADGMDRDCEIALQSVATRERTGFTGTIRDVTERNQLERQFLDAQRRESLGVLAGGVAHDFNNLLQGIVSHTEMLEQGSLPESQRASSLQAILRSAETAGSLCNRLLEYTGKSRVALEPVRLADAVTEITAMLSPPGYQRTAISVDVSDAETLVQADETVIRQVLLNLVQNALDACGEGGRVRIRVQRKSSTATPLVASRAFGRTLGTGDYLCIDVSDTGEGITPEALVRIFDPFYTTKDTGHGLGLSAVLGILKRHEGTIFVRSRPGEGSIFRIALPVCEPVADGPGTRGAQDMQRVD